MVLLVTTDFSSNSKTALRFALQIAKQMPCKIVLYHLLDIPLAIIWSKLEETLDKCTHDLKKMAQSACNKEDMSAIKFEYIAEIGDDVNDKIIACGQKVKADFICIGTHGAGTFKKMMGTNTSILINTSPIPVIAVPQNYRSKPIKKIAYASDFENIESELDTVKKLAASFKAPIDVYHFNYQIYDAEVQEVIKHIKDKYQSDLVRIITPKIAIHYSLVENIQRTAKNEQASLLVMFSRSKENWFQRFFLDSTTADVTFEMQMPLIAFRR